MGNGVNVGAVWHVLREHVLRDEELLKRTAPAAGSSTRCLLLRYRPTRSSPPVTDLTGC